MSRGPGKIQREILKILREHDQTASPQQAAEGLDAIELAALVHYGRAGWCERLLDPQQESTVRRALAGLKRKGLVFRLGTFGRRSSRCRWRVPPPDMVLSAQLSAQRKAQTRAQSAP